MPDVHAAVYARIAFRHNPGANGPDRQIAEARAYIVQRGYPITHVYQDIGSGLKEDRPGLRHMMADAHALRFDVVVMHDPARLCRTWALFQRYYSVLREELGIEVVFTVQDIK